MPKIDEVNLLPDVTLANLHLTISSAPVTNLCKCSVPAAEFQQINTEIVPAFQYPLPGSAECSEQHEIHSTHALLTSEIRNKPQESSEFSEFNESTARAMLAKGHEKITAVQ